jgi:hypothetical protein
MSWLCTRIKVCAALLVLVSPGAWALDIESAVMPGAVIQGHADLEGTCSKCHTRFDRSAQARLCLDCHKAVRTDVDGRIGYHGRIRDSERDCRRCHTDHKGRNAKIVSLNDAAFDHALTDFALSGKHKGKACASCHRPGVRYSQAPSDCVSCHRKDDKHKGGLGPKCGNCHNEDNWKQARFDHEKTKFPLRRAHAMAGVKCDDCHLDHRYAGTPRECASCHREDDATKGHKGHFGTRCEKCHDEGTWKASTFRHERDTRYPLLDRHRLVKCENCHRAPLFQEKTPSRCVACHRANDVHKASLGDKCEKCHSPRRWKDTAFDHDGDTKFPLRDKHKAAKCDGCHKDAGMREKLHVECNACHERDDRERGHKGGFGEKCESCHDARGFKPATFEHRRDAGFALGGKHAKAACAACHKTPLYRTKTETGCHACHKDQDVHFATYGLECANCHVDEDWRKIKPDAPLPAKPEAGGARRAASGSAR